jgi:5'-nucleotidase
VPDIDVIVSGHTHETFVQPLVEGKTLIVQTGRYGSKLGKLSLRFDQGAPALESYELISLDDQTAGDPAVAQMVDGFIDDVDALLVPHELKYSQVLAETAFDLTRAEVAESTVGDLVTDAYRHGAMLAEPGETDVLAFESSGVIRANIAKGKTGKIWFADLYRVMPMGVSSDGVPGYPLASFYLTGKEIALWLEINSLARLINQDNLFFQLSGATVKYKTLALPLNTIASATLSSGQPIDLDSSTKCYKVVSNVMVSEQLALAGKYSVGLLEIEPKLPDCVTKVADLHERVIDRDPATPGLQELKHWRAMVDYLSQLPDLDGDKIPDIPQDYAAPQGCFAPN